jgi:hypothetical protein
MSQTPAIQINNRHTDVVQFEGDAGMTMRELPTRT